MQSKFWRFLAVLVLLLVLVSPASAAPSAEPAKGPTNYDTVMASEDVIAGDDVTASDDVSAGDTVSGVNVTASAGVLGATVRSTGNTTIGAKALFTSATVVTITNGCTITPTATYQPLAAAGAVAFTDIVAGTAGQLLVLINTSAQTITITDTATTMLSGNAALGQYDTLMLWSDGVNWIQVAPEGDN